MGSGLAAAGLSRESCGRLAYDDVSALRLCCAAVGALNRVVVEAGRVAGDDRNRTGLRRGHVTL